MPRALSQDELFPKAFTRRNEAGVPVSAIVFSGVVGSALVLMNYSEGLVGAFKALILLSTLAVLLPYTVCSMAELVMQWRDKQSSVTSAIIALVALAFSIFAIVGSGWEVTQQGTILLLAGLPFYFWSKHHYSQ